MLSFDDMPRTDQTVIVQVLQSALAISDSFPVMLPNYDELDEKPTAAMTALTDEFIRYVLRERRVPAGWERMLANILTSVHFVWINLYADLMQGKQSGNETFYGVVINQWLLDRVLELAKSFSEGGD